MNHTCFKCFASNNDFKEKICNARPVIIGILYLYFILQLTKYNMKTKKRKKKKKPGKQGDENEEESKVRACAIVHVYIHMYNWLIIVYSIITY